MSVRVCLGISSFRNDEAVLSLLEKASKMPYFERLLVVDSLGREDMPERAKAAVADRVPLEYLSAKENLGAAGNLYQRMQSAADSGADWLYALNHDATLRSETIEQLLKVAAEKPDAGALYPLRRLSARGMRYDVSGTSPWPWRTIAIEQPPREPLVKMHWSSSNGALYNLAPFRRGVRPWKPLWHGTEDIDYGWSLEAEGYEQWMVTSAVVEDNYEFKTHGPGGRVHLVDKPAWHSYYNARNVLMASMRSSKARTAVASLRVAIEFGVTLVARDQKRERLRNLSHGVIDALRGRGGKWIKP